MFHWNHQYILNVEASIKEAWNFFIDLNHWAQFDKRFEACFLEGDFKSGARVKVKIKDQPNTISILLTEVEPYKYYRTLIKQLFFRQKTYAVFKEMAVGKTQITFHYSILSPFTFLLKSTFLKRVEQTHKKLAEAFKEQEP